MPDSGRLVRVTSLRDNLCYLRYRSTWLLAQAGMSIGIAKNNVVRPCSYANDKNSVCGIY